MASDLLEVIIKAIDQASGPAKSVDNAFDKLGNTATNSNQKMGQASQMTEQKMQQLKTSISDVSSFTASATSKGASQFKRYNSSVQDSIIKFNTLDDETQEWLNRLNNAHNPQVFYELNSKCQEAVSKFQQLDSLTDTWSGSLDYARSKMELMGNSTETLKGKAQTVGTAIQTYVGNKWDTIKGKVSGFGSFIKSNLSSALSYVGSKISSLGNAFSGLGGVISGVFGAMGMNSVKDMTLGLSIARDRVKSLYEATVGADTAATNLFNKMDTDTTNSFVALDELTQAMSTFKMSTNASTSELEAMEPVLLNLGNRAVLMGKDSNEALNIMQGASKGLNGEFETLQTNFGITSDKLKELGWSGASDDVEGYTKAIQEYLEKSGSMDGLMDTTSGKIATLQKNFKIAGRSLGNELMPYLNDALDLLNKWSDPQTGNGIAKYAIGVMGLASGFATLAPSIAPVLSTVDSLNTHFGSFRKMLGDGSTVLGSFWQTLKGGQGILAAVTAGYDAMAISEYIALAPLLAIIAAIIALGIAVYEVGKYFGWWTDVGSMLEAMWAGVQRLWSAFINHPDVQGFLAGVSEAFSVVSGAIMWAVNGILEFFNISQGGEFDAVHAIIMGIGAAWEVLGGHLRTAYEILAYLAPYVMEVFGTIQEQVGAVADVFQQFQNGQVNLLDVIWSIGSAIYNVWLTIQMQVGSIVVNLASNLLTWAIQAGLNFLNGISLYLSQVAGRVRAYLMNTLTNIISVATRWVNTGRQKASQFLNGVISFFKQLPGRALSILLRVVSSIISAGSQWVNNAKSKATSVVTGVVGILHGLPGKISSALSGVVSAITGPFKSAYDRVCGVVDNIKSKVSDAMEFIGSLGGAAGGDLAAGGDSPSVSDFNIFTGEYNTANSGTEKIEVEETLTIILDFINVPSDIDTDLLIRSLTDPKVLSALVSNPKFQDLDAKIKAKIDGKYRRSVGG